MSWNPVRWYRLWRLRQGLEKQWKEVNESMGMTKQVVCTKTVIFTVIGALALGLQEISQLMLAPSPDLFKVVTVALATISAILAAVGVRHAIEKSKK